MAFRFKSKHPDSANQNQPSTQSSAGDSQVSVQVESKLSSAELNKLIKQYPSWLRGNSCIKNLPAVYHGVLGQVQVQPKFSAISNPKLARQPQQNDYLNRFTDTERVYKLLLASRLPSATLATIWAHANKTFPGRLSNREVCLALALIAIFQRPDNSNLVVRLASKDHKLDLYEMVRSEQKPPIAKLFPISPTSQITSINHEDQQKDILLVELDDYVSKPNDKSVCEKSPEKSTKLNYFKANIGNLMDTDVNRFEMDFKLLSDCWLRSMKVLKEIFKESFDILNVRHGRDSAIEALGTCRGQEFSRNLSLCYPLAYNLSQTVRKWVETINKPQNPVDLFENGYVDAIGDLMRSINEYWAVLISLFHQTGHKEFIEIIMDSLDNNASLSIKSPKSVSDIAHDLGGSGTRPTICSLCQRAHHLSCDSIKELNLEDKLSTELIDLLLDQELITDDEHYYYHSRCANFWLNYVDSNKLPFRKDETTNILTPSQ